MAYSEGNSTYLADAPHLLNMEKKRLFARCLSQLRRLHGMKYDLHPIALIQTIFLRESQKVKHLSAQESSEWSRRMYQLSLNLDQRENEDTPSVTDGDDSLPRFTPTLTKAKSFLGGSWSSNRQSSEPSSVSQVPLFIDTSTTSVKKPPFAPPREGQQQINIPSTIPFETTSPLPPSASPSSSPPPRPARPSESHLSPSPDEDHHQQQTVPSKKSKGLKKLFNAMKFKTKSSDSDSAPSDNGLKSIEKSAVVSAEHRPKSDENMNQKVIRKMIL
jgi:hypothetical protein